MNDAVNQYSYLVRQVQVDGSWEFEASVREFPDVVVYGQSADEALSLARSVVSESLEVLSSAGLAMPVPAERIEDFSGRITLRLPKWLHRSLSMSAQDEDCSLNQQIVNLLIDQTAFFRAKKEMVQWRSEEPAKKAAPVRSNPHLRVVKSPQYPQTTEWRKTN